MPIDDQGLTELDRMQERVWASESTLWAERNEVANERIRWVLVTVALFCFGVIGWAV